MRKTPAGIFGSVAVMALLLGPLAGQVEAAKGQKTPSIFDAVSVTPVKKGADPIQTALQAMVGPGRLVVDHGAKAMETLKEMAKRSGRQEWVPAAFLRRNGSVDIVNFTGAKLGPKGELTLSIQMASLESPRTGFFHTLLVTPEGRSVRRTFGASRLGNRKQFYRKPVKRCPAPRAPRSKP